jgi:hypothetical protein
MAKYHHGTGAVRLIAAFLAGSCGTALLAALPAQAAEYYACDCGTGADADCVAGDDTADGTSPAAAWRTYEMARSRWGTLLAGDSIRLCRGGAFTVESGSRWFNAACEPDSPCTLTDYEPPWGGGDEGRPIVWRGATGHAFSLEDGGDADHDGGYVFSNLELRCADCDVEDGWGFFLYNDVDDVVIENVLIDGFGIGVHLAGSNPCSADPECDGKNSRLTLRNSTIVNSISQGFLGAGDETVIENNYFENSGTRAVFDHNIYYSGASEDTVGSRISGNELYRSSVRETGSCEAVSLVVHGSHRGLVIEGNLVREDAGAAGQGCWGIAVDGGYDEAESFTDTVIRGNEVRNVGNTGIGVSSCVNCVIENNVIIHEQDFGIIAIAAPDRERGAGDAEMTNVDVRNNSIYISGAGGTGISVGGEGSGHSIVSNAVLYTGTGRDWSCFDADLPAASYEAIDYNACHFPNAGSGGEWESGSGALAAWQAASGFDGNSMQADPGFSSPAAPDYDLSAASETSAIVDAGHPALSASNDFYGRPRDERPDIGAFEFGAPPPPDDGDEGVEPPPDGAGEGRPDGIVDAAADMGGDGGLDVDGAEGEPGEGEGEGCGCAMAS